MAIYRKQKHHYQSELWHETEGGGTVEDNMYVRVCVIRCI